MSYPSNCPSNSVTLTSRIMKCFTGKREFLSMARGGSHNCAHVYVTQCVCGCVVDGAWAHGSSQLAALRMCAPRGSLTTPPTAAVLRVRCLHSRLCCSRHLAIYRETFSDSPAALENPFEPLDHESGCDLQDRCRREREDSALVR